MSTFSHCPAWCDLPAGHRPRIHSTTVAEYVGDSSTISVRLVAYHNYRPYVQLHVRGDEAAVLGFDAEQARAIAAILAAAGASDVARAVRDACAVVEEAAS